MKFYKYLTCASKRIENTILYTCIEGKKVSEKTTLKKMMANKRLECLCIGTRITSA